MTTPRTLLLGGLLLSLVACQRSTESNPAGKAPNAVVASDSGAPVAAAKENAPDPWKGRSDLIQSPPAGQPVPLNLPPVERFTLSNKLPVLAVPDHALPLVSFHLVVLAGLLEEGESPVGQFAAEMLDKGTRAHTAEQIAETIDFVGGKLRAWADYDGTHISCEVLAKDQATCLTLLPEVAIEPVFPEKEMSTIRDRLIAEVKQVHDNDGSLAEEHLNNLLWGDGHPRGIPLTVKRIQAVDREQLRQWHATHFHPNNALLALAGDIDPAELKGALEKSFGSWKAAEVSARPVFPEPKLQGMSIRLVDKPDQTQSQIRVGHLGIRHADPDLLPTVLMNYSLGAGFFSSRLMKVVRAEGGKTYGASSRFDLGGIRGAFEARTFTRNAETVTTLKMVLDEIRKMRTAGPTEAELKDACSNLSGSYPLSFQAADDIASALLRAQLHSLSDDFVRQYPVLVSEVTLEQAAAAAKKHLDPDNVAVVIVGKAADVEPQLKAAGMAYEKVGYLEATSPKDREQERLARLVPADPQKAAAGRKLLEAALAAKGGAEKLKAVRSLSMKGKFEIAVQGQKLAGEVTRLLALPDRQRTDLKLPMGAMSMVITPDKVWQGMGPKAQVLDGAKADQERSSLLRDADFILLHALDPSAVVEIAEPVQRGGSSLEVVQVRSADGLLSTKLLFNPSTHLLSRLEYEKEGETSGEDYSDYRAVDGIQISFKQHQEGGGPTADITLDEVKLNVPVPDGLFDMPAQAPEATK